VSTGGLSATRLRKMHDVLAGHVERGEMPGLVALVARRGQVHVDAIGYEEDAIFRIASMTKPVAAAAAMTLVEEARILLDDPADRVLPELAEMTVLRTLESSVDDTVPAARPITLRDLLTFTMGTGLVFAAPDAYPIQRAMEEAGIGPGPPDPKRYPRADEWMRRLGSVPLVYQPGEAWMYNTGAEVLGVLIARVSGRTFGEFLRERIFEPLGMKDTGFFVPPANAARLAVMDEELKDRWSGQPAFESGGGGLVSTAADYLRFSEMMLGRGERAGVRILSRPSVETMTMDHLSPEQKARSPWLEGYWRHHGWGFGMMVVTSRFDIASTPGRYGWDGGLGTSWRADPREAMTTILLTPKPWDSPGPPPVFRDFATLAYSALDD
jgi:CubicO group peptidase (beta-lactamase class C family)